MPKPSIVTLENLKEWFNTTENPVWLLYSGERITEVSKPIATHKHTTVSASWHHLLRTLAMFGKGKYVLDTRKTNANANNHSIININLEDYNFSKYFSANEPNLSGTYGLQPSYQPQAPKVQQPQQDHQMMGLVNTLLQHTLSGTNQPTNVITSRFHPEVESYITNEVNRRENDIKGKYLDKLDIEKRMLNSKFNQLAIQMRQKMSADPTGNFINAFSRALEKDPKNTLSGVADIFNRRKQTVEIGTLDEGGEVPKEAIDQTSESNEKEKKSSSPNMNTIVYGSMQIQQLTGFPVEQLILKMMKLAKEDPKKAAGTLNMLLGFNV
jgi:hypothetical protein